MWPFSTATTSTPVGFATQVVRHVPRSLSVHVHDAFGRWPTPSDSPRSDGERATPSENGFRDYSQSLDIVVNMVPPPNYFGLISQADTTQGLDGASDSGVLGNPSLPATFTDRITNDKTLPVRRRRGERDRSHLSGHQRRRRPADHRPQPRYLSGRDRGRAYDGTTSSPTANGNSPSRAT